MTALHWSSNLDKLQAQGVITGFVLITGVSAAVCQLVRTFYDSAEPPKSYSVWGTKLIVLHQTDSWYLAVSSRKRLCLAAINLPSGVLLVSFERGIPTVVLSAIHQALRPNTAGAADPAAQASTFVGGVSLDARSRAAAANSQGTSIATQLSNDLLTEQNIQGVELPDVLKQDMATAVKDVTAQLPPATTEPGDGIGPDGSGSGSRWHCNAPVFNSLTLPEALRMLQQVLAMHEKELSLKHELLACFEKIAGGMASDASRNASSSSSHAVGGSGRLKVDGPDGLSRQLTAAVTTWMEVSADVQELARAFQHESPARPQAYHVLGTKLIVLHQTDSWYLAVSSRKRLCLAAINLPSGVLLVSFERGIPTVVLSAIHQALKLNELGTEARPHDSNLVARRPVSAC
eukprot:gene1752-2092_t